MWNDFSKRLGPALVAVTVLAVQRGDPASAQIRLAPGNLSTASGSPSSAGFRLTGGMGFSAAQQRSGSATRDLIGGFVGGAFSSQATVVLNTVGGTYSAVTVPLTMTSNTVASVFDELGSPDNTRWRLAHWSTADSAYIEAGGALTTVDRGLGYYLITEGSGSVSATGLPPPTNEFLFFQTRLGNSPPPGDRAAWTQLGNPFLYPLNAAAMIVSDGVNVRLIGAASNNMTEHTVKVWTGSAYVDAATINGRQPFWVRKVATGNVDLFILPVASTTGTPAPSLAKPAGADWAIALTVRQGETSGEPMLLGAAPVAAEGWNTLASSRAPAPPGVVRPLSLHVPHSEWGRLNGDYVRDFRPAAETMSWDVTLSGGNAPGEIALSLDAFDLPAGTRVSIADPAEGWARELRAGESLALAALGGGRKLRVTATKGSTVEQLPSRDVLRFAYPNPFAERAGLAFQLSRAGRVTVGIFDVAGREVRSLGTSEAAAGEHVITWDGRDQSGRAAPAGVYLARYRAGATDGIVRLVKLH